MSKSKKTHISREISWLSFNSRVLQEAADEKNPLIERLRFLGIFSNNQDEFFRIRVATLKRTVKYHKKYGSADESNPKNILKEINSIVAQQQLEFNEIYHKILENLEKKKIFIINENDLNQEQAAFVKEYFNNILRPHLFPIMLNNIDDFSVLRDQNPFLAVHLQKTDKIIRDSYALIELPDQVSRFLILPEKGVNKYVILIDDVIRFCLEDIFHIFDYDKFSAYTIKFTRDAELDIDNDVSKSLMELISESLKQRKSGSPLRFIYDKSIPANLLQILRKKLSLSKSDTLIAGGRYHNFRDFIKFPNIGNCDLQYPIRLPLVHKYLAHNKSILSVIREKDVMLHYPYHSFQYIIDLLREASIDPEVRSIKMTIYRLAKNSNVISALVNAARNGKSVTVIMEIQARFDEKANISWAEKLQDEGVRIIQSRTGFKIHSKLILIHKRENKKDNFYVNIGTGNFNEDTAKTFEDFSLLTCDSKITTEVRKLFDLLEFGYKNYHFRNLIVSPFNTRDFFCEMLDNEIKNIKNGKEAWAIIKINNLVDEKMISKLYQASRAGVKIRIISRSTCVLIPGIKNITENIEAFSIVDRFLEHSRVFIFCNGGDKKFYISSADWMVRNFDFRIEVTCPIYNIEIQKELWDIIQFQLNDNVKARLISADMGNSYRSVDGKQKIQSQSEIYNYLAKLAADNNKTN